MQVTRHTEYGTEKMDTLQYFVSDKNAIIVQDAIDSACALRVISELYYYSKEDPKKRIDIYIINSPGGIIDAALTIMDAAKLISNPIRTIGMGMVASAASFLLTVLATEKRLVSENAELMYHQPLLMTGTNGQASDIAIAAEKIVSTKRKVNYLIAKASHLSLEQINQDFDRDCWLDPKQAIKKGLIDGIMSKEDFS